MDTVAYGSIYLDDNEDVPEMTAKQIEAFKQKIETTQLIFFDIICKPNQIETAIGARGYVQQELFHELGQKGTSPFLQYYVAIGFGESDRPAREAMMHYVEAKKK